MPSKMKTLLPEQLLAQQFSDSFPTEYLSADTVVIAAGDSFSLDVGALLRAKHEVTWSAAAGYPIELGYNTPATVGFIISIIH